MKGCSSKSPDFEVVCILSLTGQVMKQLGNCLFKTAKSGDFAERAGQVMKQFGNCLFKTAKSGDFAELVLTDPSGKVVRMMKESVRSGVTQLVITGLDHLPQGMYFVRITETATGKVSVEKLIKNQ